MEIVLQYSQEQLHEAASFIWENNESVSNWPSNPKSVLDVLSHIRDSIRKIAKSNAKILVKEIETGIETSEWFNFTGTGGYFVIPELIEKSDSLIIIGVDILVDPAVSKKLSSTYVDEVIDIS